MDTSERGIKIGEVSQLSGLSIKALRHYDEIGLLKPSIRDESGYRRYLRDDLLRLQSILLYRELELPLKEIKLLLGNDEVSKVDQLRDHKQALKKRKKRIDVLLNTIEKTINHLEYHMPLSNKDLYEGLSQEEIEAINKEVSDSFDPKIVAQSNDRVSKMSKSRFAELKEEEKTICLELAALMETHSVESPEVQELIERHYHWINNFYDCTPQIYEGLSELYVSDARFKAHYEKIQVGLAEFLNSGMRTFIEGLED